MATAKQIVALLNSHFEGDSEQFLSIALQVAAAEARQGRRETAEELKQLLIKPEKNPSSFRVARLSPRPPKGGIGERSLGVLSKD